VGTERYGKSTLQEGNERNHPAREREGVEPTLKMGEERETEVVRRKATAVPKAGR